MTEGVHILFHFNTAVYKYFQFQMKQDTSPVQQPTLCSSKTVTLIDVTNQAMVPSDACAWKTKINKTAKYKKIQQ